MEPKLYRRDFLRSSTALGLGAGLASWGKLSSITPANAAAMSVGPDVVRFRPEIEPVVRWIEDTPRDDAFEVAVRELKKGLSYRELLGGLFLAGIRNVKPRPVGFKFHAVMVMNSAHLLGQAASVEDRLLPMFWALDNFKSSQAQDVKEGDWTLGNVNESKVPKPSSALKAFDDAMDRWDSDDADSAVAGLCRSSGASETMEAIWRHAVRDQRNIGHKPIFAMQCRRTLNTIGWQHAEPVLRSLTYGLLDLQGDSRPVPVGPYAANLENQKKVRADWQGGKHDRDATRAMLDVLRQADGETAAAEAVKQLNKGVSAQSIWDAVSLYGCELLMKSPGIVSLHTITATNALHFIFEESGVDSTRKLALLQAVGWLPIYRDRIKPAGPPLIDALEPISSDKRGEEAVSEIFQAVGKDRMEAARRTVGLLGAGGSSDAVFAAARKMIFNKGRDSHDYKFGAAIWEEFLRASDPKWQAPILASSMLLNPAANAPDSPLMIKAREAVKAVLG